MRQQDAHRRSPGVLARPQGAPAPPCGTAWGWDVGTHQVLSRWWGAGVPRGEAGGLPWVGSGGHGL